MMIFGDFLDLFTCGEVPQTIGRQNKVTETRFDWNNFYFRGMFDVGAFELGLGGLADLVEIFLFFQVVISESPGGLEDAFDIHFLV